MMQWQTAIWKEVLNDNFVTKGSKAMQWNDKETMFILKSYSVFLFDSTLGVFKQLLVFSSPPYLELAWVILSSWIPFASGLSKSAGDREPHICHGKKGRGGAPPPPPKSAGEERCRRAVVTPSRTTQFREKETGLRFCPQMGLGLQGLLKVALNPFTWNFPSEDFPALKPRKWQNMQVFE